jgi:hypothetical protein
VVRATLVSSLINDPGDIFMQNTLFFIGTLYVFWGGDMSNMCVHTMTWHVSFHLTYLTRELGLTWNDLIGPCGDKIRRGHNLLVKTYVTHQYLI